MMDTLADELVRWDTETRAILLSIKRIVKYFGSVEEYDWIVAVLHEPETYFEGILPAFREPTWDLTFTGVSIPRLTFERGTAEKINPLLVIITELWPDFIGWAREELEPAHFKAVARFAGRFFGDMGLEVADPIWRRFPDLALEGYPIGDPARNSGEARWTTFPRKVVIDTADTLADEVVRWETETRAILRTITRVVDYFGTDEVYESVVAALREPEAHLEGVLATFRDPAWRAEMPERTDLTFKCERSIAEKISPMLQILVEPVPAFVPWAREELEQAHASAVRAQFDAFTKKIREVMCDPLWQSFRDLAPKGYPLAAAQPGSGDAPEQVDTKLPGPTP